MYWSNKLLPIKNISLYLIIYYKYFIIAIITYKSIHYRLKFYFKFKYDLINDEIHTPLIVISTVIPSIFSL